jgi:hypothetical protein
MGTAMTELHRHPNFTEKKKILVNKDFQIKQRTAIMKCIADALFM